MGAWYGPVAYLWIVFGCIFAGAMHDYMSGMLSIRHDGAGLPELVGKYLGGNTRKVMLVFSVLLLMMVGAVFVYSPAIILDGICNSGSFVGGKMFWIILIFIYRQDYRKDISSLCLLAAFHGRCADDRTVHQVANLA